MNLDHLLEFAAQTAVAAGEITRKHFQVAAVEFKGDGSEVTAADREAEAFIRGTIEESFPHHGIFGEEGAQVEARSDYRWIIDPIDGTRSFASGVPLYGVLLALEHQGEPILGCAHFPELGDTVAAANGAGCWWNGRAARVSDCDRLQDARLITSGLEYWRDWGTEAGNGGFQRLLQQVRFGRTWGDCFGYILVATGRAEILADPACGAPWDYAPMLPILNEAGGSFTTLLGQPVTAWSSALACNLPLRSQTIDFWRHLQSDDHIQTSTVADRRRA